MVPHGEHNLGPLPKGDRQDTLQQLSLQALRNRLPESKFLFRDERGDDKGVDGALEAKEEIRIPNADGRESVKYHFSNCRSQMQLKSTDTPRRNQDGSVSYSIEISNLNYLLNGPCPLYFLWLAPDDELRYVWAIDEWRRLDTETPEWREQATFTIRFKWVLNTQAVGEIHTRIIEKAKLARQINESLARSSLAERVIVSIDQKSLQATDPHKIYEWLTSCGMTIVSSGYGLQVLNWIELLNPEVKREPKVLLIAAYAAESLGRYLTAIGYLAEVSLQKTKLSPSDQQFLNCLRTSCEYYTGRIGQKEYHRRQDNWAKDYDRTAIATHKLEALRQERLGEHDPDRRAAKLAEMRKLVDEVRTAEDCPPARKLQARVILLSAEGDDLSAQQIENLSLIQSRQDMGYSTEQLRRQAASKMEHTWDTWQKNTGVVLQEAEEIGHPLLIADTLTSRVVSLLGVIQIQRCHALAYSASWEPHEQSLYALMNEADRARLICTQAGSVEGEARTKLLLADLYEILGQVEAAKGLAEGVLEVAIAMNYKRLESHASGHITGQTMVRQFEAKVIERQSQDEDKLLANAPDEIIRRMARFSLNSANLPDSRLPFVERESFSLRTVAQERVNWCRHIQLLQDRRHQQSPITHYQTDPPRVCHCELHRYVSAIAVPDPKTVIAAFKQAYCTGCSERNPKL